MPSTAEKWDAPDGIPPIATASSIKLPWQPLFWSDFLLSTAHLLPLELGYYARLYGYYWQTGSLPRSHERCFGIAGAISLESQAAVIRLLEEFFYEAGPYYRHASLDAQLEIQRQTANKQSTKGREAANKRWAKNTASAPCSLNSQPSVIDDRTSEMPLALPKQCQLKSEVNTIGDESPITPLVEQMPRPDECRITPEIRVQHQETTLHPPETASPPPAQLALFPLLTPVTSRQTNEIQDIFTHWQTVMQHPGAKLTKDRVVKIRARLREGYTVVNLKQAIDGASVDPFLMGDNDRLTRYDDITTIFKNGGMVERLMEKHAFIPQEQHAGDGGHRGHRDGPQKRPDRFEHRQQQFERCVAKLQAAEQALAQQGFVDPLGAAYRF